MSIVTIDDTHLTNIASAIRNKKGNSTKYKPSEMATAISEIETGGGGITPTGTKEITANGTYDVTNYASANVNVASSGGTMPTKGVIVDEWDENGYAKSVTIVGFTEIPHYFLYNSGYKGQGNSTGTYVYSYLGYATKWSIQGTMFRINKYAFYNSSINVTELSDKISKIDEYAFYNCTNLALTKLPDNYEIYQSYASIPQYCFYNCTNLNIKETNIYTNGFAKYCFYGCENITELTINASKAKVSFSESSFWNCYRLTSVIMPNITAVPTLQNANAFTNTPLKGYTNYTDGQQGYFYVPDELVDSMKTATNWSQYADHIKGLSELPA